MWNYPKSALHQAAIDAMQPERDREAETSRAAVAKMRRNQDARQALLDCEASRLAVLAKTQRLRSERLQREAEIEAIKQAPHVIKCRARSTSKIS